MPVIIIKNRQVASLDEMSRLALKRIFDKKHMTYEEEALLTESIENWPKKIDLGLEERKRLKIIINALSDNERGKYEMAKETLKRAGLDYGQVYGREL